MSRRVLYLESGLGRGGSAFSLCRLVCSLDRERYEAHVAVSHDAAPFERLRRGGVPVQTVAPFRPLFGRAARNRTRGARVQNFCSVYGNWAADALYNGLRLAGYVRRHGIDLIHLNNGLLENVSGAVAARLARLPCVCHLRGSELLTRVEKRLRGWASAVITLNGATLAECRPVFGADKVFLIPNGVDLEAFENPDPERIRREFDLGPDTFAIGTLARLVEGKGIPEFIAAAARVHERQPQTRFFVVGHDPTAGRAFEGEMRKLAGELGIAGKLFFTGWRDDRIDIVAAMDLMLQISTTFPEGMSLAPLEAMALRKPVIVTATPGYELSVVDGENGFVVPPADVDALTRRVLMLAGDRAGAAQMGAAGYETARRRFDVRITARRVQEVYDGVLQGVA
jgi:glycosyltransferase involved in cell wall biosynthesis